MKTDVQQRDQPRFRLSSFGQPQKLIVAITKNSKDNIKTNSQSVRILVESIYNPEARKGYSFEEVPALAAFGSPQELSATLAAVVELRRQHHAEPVARKQPFPGVRALLKAGVDSSRTPASPGPAYRFMRDQYGADIDGGRLGPTDLRDIDPALYQAVAHEAEGQGRKVSDYLRDGSRDAIYSKRRQAIAAIIGAPYDELSTFLSAVRDRREQSAQKGHGSRNR